MIEEIHRGETMLEVRVLKAISETMTCDKCPYPCKAKEQSSQANCVTNWSEILSKINPKIDWKDVRFMVAEETA